MRARVTAAVATVCLAVAVTPARAWVAASPSLRQGSDRPALHQPAAAGADGSWCDLGELHQLPAAGTTRMMRPRPEMPLAVAVDVLGDVHVLVDAVPPLNYALSTHGVVDGQIQVVADAVTGAKYYLTSGEVRGSTADRAPNEGVSASNQNRGLVAMLVRRVVKPEVLPLTVVPHRFNEAGMLQVAEADAVAATEAVASASAGLLTRLARRLLDEGGDDGSAAATPEASVVFTLSNRRLFPDDWPWPKQLAAQLLPAWAPAHEQMQSIVACLGDVELGRSQFKVLPADTYDPAMDQLLEDTFGADDVADFMAESGERPRVSPLISVFTDPTQRRKGVGLALFRAMLRESRVCGYNYAVLVHQDNGSGSLIAWYEQMGFILLPEDNCIGLQSGMIARLPLDPNDEYYMAPIRAAADVYDGAVL